MSFTRVSSSDDRALAIRDHLLTIVRERGRLQVQRGPMQLSVFEEGGWVVDHWTPLTRRSLRRRCPRAGALLVLLDAEENRPQISADV
jgi:hypothetical protein